MVEINKKGESSDRTNDAELPLLKADKIQSNGKMTKSIKSKIGTENIGTPSLQKQIVHNKYNIKIIKHNKQNNNEIDIKQTNITIKT